MTKEKLMFEAEVYNKGLTSHPMTEQTLIAVLAGFGEHLQNLQQCNVSRSVEFEKPQPTLSADEIKATAEMLWKKPMKLEAVKMAMKLGYSLKDAKAYCELHFG